MSDILAVVALLAVVILPVTPVMAMVWCYKRDADRRPATRPGGRE